MRVEISHFELGCRLKPGDYPLSYYVVVGDVLNDYIAIDGHVCPDNTDQNKPVPFWQVWIKATPMFWQRQRKPVYASKVP